MKVDTDMCNFEIRNNGRAVAVVAGSGIKEVLNEWCQRVYDEHGLRVDWFFMGGRAVIKTIDDTEAVRALLPDFEIIDGVNMAQYKNGQLVSNAVD